MERLAVLATGNAHKLDELQAALPGWEIGLLGAVGYPPEDGDTYLENARIKAHFGRRVADARVWVLADDSGIELDALGGAPGVQSSRWAGGDEVGRTLEALGGRSDRGARFVSVVVAIAPGGEEFTGTGVLTGRIADEATGDEGFGYDPVFIPDGESQTVAVLGNDWKRTNSHRARAALALLEAIDR